MFGAGPLQQAHRFHVEAPAEEVARRLEPLVHHHDGPFVLTFKLSPGGIVSRVMETPVTPLQWFGEVSSERLRMTAMPAGSDVTPFQPILRGELESLADGTRLSLRLEPHPGQHTWSLPFGLAGVMLAFWGGVLLSSAISGLGIAALLFGLALAFFPPMRARLSFERDCARELARLQRDLTGTGLVVRALPSEP